MYARARPYSGNVPKREAPRTEQTRSGRDRILTAAYDLFSRSGVRAVGVDTITAEADVAKMTLYRNFGSKNDLALAFLELREERWVKGWLQPETQARAASPAGRLLAIFEIFTEWFEHDDFEGCPFVTSLLEFEDRDNPVRQACVEHLAGIRAYLCELATAAGAQDPERLAAQWHVLLQGSIVAAHEGDLDAAMKARELGLLLLEREGLRSSRRSAAAGISRRTSSAPSASCGWPASLTSRPPRPSQRSSTRVATGRSAFDLADLEFVDVAGLRALRGTHGHPIAIAAPSDAVLRLVGMLGWDSDPGVELRPARAA